MDLPLKQRGVGSAHSPAHGQHFWEGSQKQELPRQVRREAGWRDQLYSLRAMTVVELGRAGRSFTVTAAKGSDHRE